MKQRDASGDNREVELCLNDAADFFDWANPDIDVYVGIDKGDLDNIRDYLLPLFSFGG